MRARPSQPLASVIMLGFGACGLAAVLYHVIAPPSDPGHAIDVALVGLITLGFFGLSALCYRGWRWGPAAAVMAIALALGLTLPPHFLTDEAALSIFLAPLVATAIGNAALIPLSTAVILALMTARAGPELVYLQGEGLFVLAAAHGVMIASRVMLTRSQRTVAAQTRAAEARAAELEAINRRLAASEQRAATNFQATPLPVVIVRIADSRVLDINDRGAQFIDRPREGVIGRTPYELGLWYSEAERDAITALVAGGEPILAREFHVRTPRGLRTVEATTAEVEIDGERCCLAIIDDTTERKRAQEELRRYADGQAILNQISRAILSLDPPAAIAGQVLPIVRTLVPCDRASVTLYDLDAERTMILAVDGVRQDELGPSTWTSTAGRDPLPEPFLRGEAWQIDDAREGAPADGDWLLSQGFRSALRAPLQVQGRVIGALNLSACAPRAFRNADHPLVSRVARQLAVVIQSAQLLEGEQAARRAAEQLRGANIAITRSLDLHRALDALLDSLEQVARYDAAGVLLREPGGVLRLRAARGNVPAAPAGADPRGWVELPLAAAGQPIGLCRMARRAPDGFSQDELGAAEAIAATAGTAIANAQLFAQARAELHARTAAEQALAEERALLARRVAERTAELRAANEELGRAALLKDAFLATMSHELRTPLNAILGHCELLGDEIYGPLNPSQQRSVGVIDQSGRHLLALISDILDLTKVASGTLPLQLAEVAVEPLCQASLRLVAAQAQARGVALSAAIDPAAGSLRGDERRLTQILVNLLSNAVKFTPSGGSVGLAVGRDEARGALRFTVWDTGIGIAEQDVPRLFQPFVQIDNALSRRYDGTGLGLALVRQLAEAHGGAVAVESAPGQGSSFTVTLPLAPQPVA